MFICKNCGSVFSQPEYRKGKTICPDCGSTNYHEANYCKLCHDYFLPDGYELWGNSEYCPECKRTAEHQLREAVLQMVDPDYIDLLRSEYDDLDYIMDTTEE